MPRENEELEAYLAETKGAALAASEASGTPPEPKPEPTPEPKPEPAQEPPPAKEAGIKAAPEPEEDEPEQIEHQGGAFVPRQALDRERHRRQDWKEKAARYEGELAALKRQLEEARQPPPAPAQPPPMQFTPPPDFNTDPRGFMVHAVQQNQQAMLNERLNMSEAFARDRIGDDKLNAYVTDFKEAAAADPSLWGKLYSQPHPYGWLTKQMDTWRMHKDIGSDPEAYRQRIIAEARAEWEAGASSPRAPVSPAANLPPSLAGVRSVASRSEPAFSGPPSMEDILAPIQNRKNGNGTRYKF